MNGSGSDEPNGALIRVAEAVSDGERVDWTEEETTHPDLSQVLESLRTLEGVAHLHRALQSAPDPIPATWGPLQIRERIGQGGFAEVFRAYDPVLEIDVALKLRKGSAPALHSKECLDEARKLAKVRHPNVLVVYGADEHDGRVGLWTELLRGQTLEERLDYQGRFSAEEAAHVGMEVCRALAAVHAAELVHRDVKTMNVMRTERGHHVLTDFGCVGEFPGLSAAKEESSAPGTPLTMAPEQLRGDSVGPEADLWGVGVLLYRLVSRRYPIEATTYGELEEKHERRELVPLRDVRPDVPAGFARVVERALSFDPRRRYPSAGAMEQALAEYLGLAIASIAPPPPARIPRGWFAIAASVAVVAIVLVVYHDVARRMPWEPRPAPQPTAAPSNLTATAHLYRDEKSGPKLLLPGSKIAPGDNLFLEILGSDSMYVYVLNEDEQGRAYALFPGPSFDLAGPLAPGVAHRLPGTHDGTPVSWQVSSTGGRETITVIASRRAQPMIEQDIASIPGASLDTPVAYGAVSPRTLEVLRGIGGLAPAPGTVSRVIKGLPEHALEGGDFWTWQIDLMNPSAR